MKQLPCMIRTMIALETLITMTNNLTDIIFDASFNLDPRA